MLHIVRISNRTLCSQTGKITAYLSQRDFVDSLHDHVNHTSPVDGVLVVDHDYLRGRQVFARVAVTYRYGREDDEMMGLNFSKEFILVNSQIGPGTDDADQVNDVQDRLIKKLGANAYPFRVQLPETAPPSVTLEGGKDVDAAALGVVYELRIYAGEGMEEKPHKRNSVAFAVRKVQYAPADANTRQPQSLVSKSFMLSPGKLNLEVSLPKDIYFHGEQVVATVHVNNCSKKTVKNIKCHVVQHIEVTMTNNQFTRIVAGMESKEGCPITPGSTLEKNFTLAPTASTNKRKIGIALDGSLKDQDANLASSTMAAAGKHVNDSLGIVVSYSLRVRVDCGAISGELQADLPFKMVHPDPTVAHIKDGQIEFEEFKNLRRGQSVSEE
ncbi:unnamed protein product, partial [Meganyctiphanes norvegica]